MKSFAARLYKLEKATGETRPFPSIVEDETSDADLDALRKRTGREIYRAKDDAFWDCFIL